jgi:hypothetical protein
VRAVRWCRGHPDLVAFLGFLVLVFAAKAPVLGIPYYWDEAGWVGAAHWLAGRNLLRAIPGLRPPDIFWGHPPGLHVLLASLFKLFGESQVVTHLLAVSFAFIGLYFTYRLGSLLYDRGTGAFAALALFLSPVYFAQSAMFLADVPVAALGVATIYFALRNAYVPYLLSATGLVLAKETGVAVVGAYLLFLLVTHRRDPRQAVHELTRYGLPLLVIGGFVAWQKLVTGEFFFILGGMPFDFVEMGWSVWWAKLCLITRWLFWDQLRSIISALIVLGLVLAPGWRRRPELLLVAVIVLVSCYPFVAIFLLRRYLMPALPFLYLLGMGALSVLLQSWRWRVGAASAFVALSIVSVSDLRLAGNGEWTMSYLTVVRTAQAMYGYLHEHHPNARVLAAWPDSVNLTRPYIGYVKSPVATLWFRLRGEPGPGEFDVVLVSSPSAGEGLKAYAARLEASGALRLVKRFETDGITSELYTKP